MSLDLRYETVVHQGTTLEVWELAFGDVLPIMDTLEEDFTAGSRLLLGKAVREDGAPLEDRVEGLSFSLYRKLLPIMLRLNGMDAAAAEADDDSGNA